MQKKNAYTCIYSFFQCILFYFFFILFANPKLFIIFSHPFQLKMNGFGRLLSRKHVTLIILRVFSFYSVQFSDAGVGIIFKSLLFKNFVWPFSIYLFLSLASNSAQFEWTFAVHIFFLLVLILILFFVRRDVGLCRIVMCT